MIFSPKDYFRLKFRPKNIKIIKKDIGAEIYHVSEKTDPSVIGSIVAENLVVTLKRPSLTFVQFYELCRNIGTIFTWGIPPEKITTLKDTNIVANKLYSISYKDNSNNCLYPGMIRLTSAANKQINAKGIDSGNKEVLSWHCNEWKAEKQFPIVALHGEQGTKGTTTQIVTTNRQFQLLSDTEKKLLRGLTCTWCHDNEVSNYKESPFNIQELRRKLIRKSPAGHEGIHFAPRNIKAIDGFTKNEFQEFKQWLESIIFNKRFYYDHEWEDGDILFMDQTISLHRRISSNGSAGLSPQILANRILNRIEHDFSRVPDVNDR